MVSRLRTGPAARFRRLVGVGGIGSGLFFALEGDHDLGRNESRPARLLDVRDYCKLHIVAHYPTLLLGAHPSGNPFHVVPVGRVGADDAGRRLRAEMAGTGMDVRFVESVPDRPTMLSVCYQYPDGSGGNITTSASAAAALEPADLDDVAALLDPRTIALAAPEVPLPVRARLLDLATSRGAFRVLALASAEVPDSRALIARADLVAMNAHEAAVFAGQAFDPMHPEVFLEGCRRAVEALQPSAALVVTAGANGAHGYAAGSWTRSPALKVPVASTAGAGDALLGGLLAGLAAGLPFANALELGGSVAAFSVTSPHTIPLDFTLDALVAFARRHGIALDETARLVEEVSA